MNLNGDFEGLTLSSILQLLCNDQKTGVLTVSCDKEESKVFFEQGTIIYASASSEESRLGFLMRNDGIISAKQLQKCLALGRESKRHLGKILVDKGYISLDTSKKYITKQVETILYNLLLWKKGKFEYKEAKSNLKGMIVTQLNPMKLILEASRRIDELSVLKEFIPSDNLVFQMSGKVQNKEEIKLNANEWKILSLNDGTRSVRQIINQNNDDEFAVYKILFSMISSGLIEQKGEVQSDDTMGENDYSAILTVFNDVLQAIQKNILDELGDRSYFLFEEIKSSLKIEFKEVFKDYHPDNYKSSNLQAISSSLAKIDVIEDPKDFLISGFSDYSFQVLKKIGEILGSNLLIKILNDIEKVLGYMKKYQAVSKEKSKIVSDMNNVVEAINLEFQITKKGQTKGRLFSLFSR
jgi:hypothetical protein